MEISQECPLGADILAMMAEGDRYYANLYPAESNHLYNAGELHQNNVNFYVAREASQVLGFGALVDMRAYGEIKRMYVAPQVRGSGIGRSILLRIMQRGRELGLSALRLETGIKQLAAIRLYETYDFIKTPAFGDYHADPLSIFMLKLL